jgi:hypothetical protein
LLSFGQRDFGFLNQKLGHGKVSVEEGPHQGCALSLSFLSVEEVLEAQAEQRFNCLFLSLLDEVKSRA